MPESLHAPGKPTVLFYGHYDVQPARDVGLVDFARRFEPTIRGGNLYGPRHSRTTKGQVHMSIPGAWTAIHKTAGKAAINLKCND